MINLNAAQKAAVNHFTGPALTLAGPGSGKTRVMTERTRMLIERTGMPEHILSVTFTNAAAEEMRIRCCGNYSGAMRHNNDKTPVFKTVHSYSNMIIRKYEKLSNIVYYRIEAMPGGKETILAKIYEEINGERADSYILSQMDTENKRGEMSEIKNYKKIIDKYNEYKAKHRLIDFNDMITFALEILTSDDPVKRRIRENEQEYYSFIQVDEAQDLTREQFEILEIVASEGNIFVVADDDQSIYGFRGAEPSCLKEFVARNADCSIYTLSQNYRSVQNIVGISDRFISVNSGRFDKKLTSENEKGAVPSIKACGDSIKQMNYIYSKIKKLKKTNENLSVGILYRNNISCLIPRAFLTYNSENFHISGGGESVEHMIFIKRVLDELLYYERKSGFVVPSPSDIFRRMLEKNFEKEIEVYCRKTRRHMKYKDVILSFLKYVCDVSGSWKDAVSLIEKTDAHIKDKSAGEYAGGGSVCLSTVHSSKGLEYDAVFIIDALQGEFPGECTCSDELEEERRLFYVAMTRAKKYLYITYPEIRGNTYRSRYYEQESVFVTELRKCICAV